MKIHYLIPLVLLSGCLEDKKPQVTECFQMAPHKDYMNAIMMNKCTGESWLLVSTPLSLDKDGKTDTTTYRWYPIKTDYREAELENRFKK